MKSVLLLSLLLVPALAQEPVLRMDLSGVWRQSARDDAAFAQPAFDDSLWAVVNLPYRAERPENYWWLRRTVTVPEWAQNRSELVLTTGGLNEVFEAFVNGEKVGSVGGPRLSGMFVARPRNFTVPGRLFHDGHATVALRLWMPGGLNWAPPRMFSGVLADSGPWLLSDRGVVPDTVSAEGLIRRRDSAVLSLISGSIWGVLALLLLISWASQRARMDLLWLALYLVSESLRLIDVYVGVAADWPHLENMYSAVTLSLSPLFLIRFVNSCDRGPIRWLTIPGLLVLAAHLTINAIYSIGDGRSSPGYSAFVPASAVFFLLMSAALIYQTWRAIRRKDRTKAAIDLCVLLMMFKGSSVMSFLGLSRAATVAASALQSEVALAIVICLTVWLIRSLGVERQRLRQEIQAAGIVQQVLLRPATHPGVDAAYFPAQEIGGDFWQAAECPDGGLVVAVGDVAGKGLSAAMVVAMVVGVIRSNAHLAPGALLRELNRALVPGSSSRFVTCCVMRISDREVRIANAGHCAPYREGSELPIAGGLPLGVVADAEWEETCFDLPPGSRITLVSDGVPEATNQNGELFGFERTCEISGRSAYEIAEAARVWGQNDDITVVTVGRAAA